ncbi:MAG: hypothetical protein ACRC4P_03630 [Aeromonas sp.]
MTDKGDLSLGVHHPLRGKSKEGAVVRPSGDDPAYQAGRVDNTDEDVSNSGCRYQG